MLPETKVQEKDIVTIVDDLSETSKAFNKFSELYFVSDNESTLRKLASEVKSTIIGGTPSDLESAIPSARRLAEEVVEALSFGNLTGALLQQPLAS